jgi:hypothetical protein
MVLPLPSLLLSLLSTLAETHAQSVSAGEHPGKPIQSRENRDNL